MRILDQPELQTVSKLLRTAGLPDADLTVAHMQGFFAITEDDESDSIVGVIGLELMPDAALLRSLAVTEQARNHGYGKALVDHAENFATNNRIRRIYLLTDSAQTFFERLGYRPIERNLAPPDIQATQEFASLCPKDSALLVKRLVPG